MDMHPAPVQLELVKEDFERTFSPDGRAERPGLRRWSWRTACPRWSSPTSSASSRCSRTCSPTPSSSPSRAAVTLRVAPAASTDVFESKSLRQAERVVAFSVRDSGIGIAEEKLAPIFEAFQQADGTTSRRYGGTGLGLSISREIAGLLGGELKAESVVGEGSLFTLFLPEELRRARRLPAARQIPAAGRRRGDRAGADRERRVGAGRLVRGQEDPDRGRRRAQRVRPHQRAGAARRHRAVRRERAPGHRDARGEPRRGPRPDGRDDAGDGRQRDHARRALDAGFQRSCRSWRSPPRR